MVKAKRSKPVSLTKVKGKTKEFKEKLMKKLEKLYTTYQTVCII